MNIKLKMRALFAGAVALAGFAAAAETTVNIDKVECGDPWTQVKVDYTLSGIDAGLDYKVAFDITSKGETHGVTNAAAKLADGATTKEIDVTELFKSAKPDPKALLAITVIALKPKPKPMEGVQLWENGPYWATCNIGATKPEESGYYFWYGDTVGSKRNAADNGWVSVEDGTPIEFSQTDPTASRTCLDRATLLSQGWIDENDELTIEHDAANRQLGGSWRMPTEEEAFNLLDKTDCRWVDNYNGTGVPGFVFKGWGSYADKSIFLPAAGFSEGSELIREEDGYPHDGLLGRYWTTKNDTSYYYDQSLWSMTMEFSVNDSGCYNRGCRFCGYPIRALRDSAE